MSHDVEADAVGLPLGPAGAVHNAAMWQGAAIRPDARFYDFAGDFFVEVRREEDRAGHLDNFYSLATISYNLYITIIKYRIQGVPEMIFQAPKLPDSYIQVIEKINKLRTELKWATTDRLNRWTGNLARSTVARAVQKSNAIEGINVTLDDAVAAVDGDTPATRDEGDRMALVGYWRAMTFVLQKAKETDYQYNENDLKSLHYMMLDHDLSAFPGRWRPSGVHVTNTASGQIVYEAPPIEIVPGIVGELIDFLNNGDEQLPEMVRAAMAHLNLTMIHPFKDGNGRMARVLQSLVLMREGIVAPEFSCIEEYIGNHSGQYYAVLGEVGQGSWHPERDALPWIRFCLTAHHHQAVTLLRRVAETVKYWEALESAVKAKGINPRVIPALADSAVNIRVTNPSYRKQAEVSNQVAKLDLKNLVLAGFLEPRGETRGRYYVAGQSVREIREANRLKQEIPDPFESHLPSPAQANQEGQGTHL